ncbi:MAG: hypothetical protein JXX14_13260 [Deltaproteobacteria bacterium]|nr:hypothetical protein [Deltaproteobacteria bacterium]
MRINVFSIGFLLSIGFGMAGCKMDAPAEQKPAVAVEASRDVATVDAQVTSANAAPTAASNAQAEESSVAAPEKVVEIPAEVKVKSETEKKKPEAKPPASTGLTGIPSCDRYVRTFEKYIKCEMIPVASRNAAKENVDAMKRTWVNFKDLPEEGKKAAADGCTGATQALMQAAEAMNCNIR